MAQSNENDLGYPFGEWLVLAGLSCAAKRDNTAGETTELSAGTEQDRTDAEH
jgi:hypothetical protein